ncbi:hypothetical protein QBC46DRAFT_159036 [Diplogelasinospora grovesii]|uniref:Ankyrin repeat protein n=1 Tax=Diplogelasinospora grovesii TaxID=303347 RepID=A0AAN6NF99_9PEZI|nr:hypothetical protein QBC46DRAFT_159036 [Diplogelasinospora grovesii]
MDAQNAVEPASTKPAAAASPKRPGNDPDQPRSSAVNRSSNATKSESTNKDPKPGASGSHANEDDGGAEGSSDAETIVLPGKDGNHSPSKVRKIIKHEDKSDREETAVSLGRKQSNGKPDRDGDKAERTLKTDRPNLAPGNGANEGAPRLGTKKKRLPDKSRTKDGSSGLSSAPASPPPQQRRRRPSHPHSDSDAETAHAKSPRTVTKERSRPLDSLVPHKRKVSKVESDDEAENRKIRRQRTSGSGLNASRKKDPTMKSNHEAHQPTRTRSVSPHPRAHRRSTSTQLLPHSSNGLSHKKKRIPAPLQSTDYHSDESSASGSPHPRSSKLRSLTTPATTESAISPAKMAPHKKHLDAHGQTFLARACAKGEYEVAKQRLQERPEDINVADYAGNTPLQISALNGFDDIVKLLVEAGCNLDCVNNDKDTPLLDAVENGHLEVVKILLGAGVNPRKANAYGQEPIDRVNEEMDHSEEIRRALQDAKQNMGERRRTSEDHQLDHTDARSSHGPESPRRSPGAPGSSSAASGRRAGTVRSTKTSNHLLYMPMDDKTLRQAAARGDEETVTRILQVREAFDDPESMVAAARGGHDLVMQLLLALGKANPDPAPIGTNDHSTPMLAAIGQENIKVIKLLLDQNSFDPTRRYKGETYFEIARRRKGPNWMEEEHMLKDAYDAFRKSHKDSSKKQSPNRRGQDREARRSRTESKSIDETSRSHKRKPSSPVQEAKRISSAKVSTSPKDRKSLGPFSLHPEDNNSPKPRPHKVKKDDKIPTIAISDREASPAGKLMAKAKRTESDIAAASSEGEAVKPRRKLVSGRELKGEREKQRRASMTSNASSMKEPSSPRDEPEKGPKAEKYHDRTKALKRDESRDRLSVSGESSGKRHRSSATPPHHGPADKDTGEAPVKRRRLDIEGKERRLKPGSSDERHLKTATPRESGSTSASGQKNGSRNRDDDERKPAASSKKSQVLAEHARRESGKSVSSESSSIHVKSEDPDVEMMDVDRPPAEDDSEARARVDKLRQEKEEKRKRQADMDAQAREAKRKEEEKRRKEEEGKEKERLRLEEEAKRRAEEEARRREEEERQRKEEEERKRREEEERKRREEEERRRIEEEQKRKEQEELEKRRIEEEERKRKEEEERQRKEAEERRRKEEEERKRKEEEERKRREEEERRKREEEERLRKEQLEREAAEAARRKREEEERERREQERKEQERKEQERREQERREQERRERAQREEMERRRAAREAEQRRIRLEQERIRLAKLPPLLRWLDGYANPKVPELAEKFRMMQGVRYDCIRPEASGTPDGREQWLLNTQVALLLGEKDLDLSRYTAWTRMPVSYIAKRIIWRLESDRYALTAPSLYELGKQLPGYYGHEDPERMSYRVIERLRGEAWEKFAALDMFFVKASDFMYIIPTINHLRNLKLTMAYRELPENEAQLTKWAPLQKWKNDPDANRNYGFAPGNKHYINGAIVAEDKPGLCPVSKTPFPEKRVPRRGLIAVPPSDPDYVRLCHEQGLGELVAGTESPRLPNGIHSSPISASSHRAVSVVNGPGSPSIPNTAAATNGAMNGQSLGDQPISPSSESGPAQARPLVNGNHGMVNGGSD